MSPHLLEAIIGGVSVAFPVVFVQWLMGRDVRTRLIVKVEQHDKDITQLQVDVKDHEKRLSHVEGRQRANGHAHPI